MQGLLDFTQGASNAAAQAVAGPVDLLAMILGRQLPMPKAPFGGSEWMRQKGLIREPESRMAGLLGEAAGMSLPVVAAAKAPQIARGLLAAGDNLRAPGGLNTPAYGGQRGATVWQGSPHKFAPEKLVELPNGQRTYVGGKFNQLQDVPPGAKVIEEFPHGRIRMEAIGTGEGAQAYGHGLYVADNPTVASSYKLPNGRPPEVLLGGAKVPPNTMEARALEDVARLGKQAAIQKIDDNIRFNEKYAPDIAAFQKGLREKVAALDESKLTLNAGHLYKVDLPDEHIARMLDWDAPLSKQPEAVRKAVAPILKDRVQTRAYGGGWGDMEPDPTAIRDLFTKSGNKLGTYSADEAANLNLPGSVVMKALGDGDKSSPAVSEMLRRLGIPGIKYLDQGSRGAGAATGTRNYVVFDDALLKILGVE